MLFLYDLYLLKLFEPSGTTNSSIASAITKCILNDEVPSIKELSIMANVGIASISRFIKELGIDGYKEFRTILIDCENMLKLKKSADFSVQSAMNLDLDIHNNQIINFLKNEKLLKKCQNIAEEISNSEEIAILGPTIPQNVLLLQPAIESLKKIVYLTPKRTGQLKIAHNLKKNSLCLVFDCYKKTNYLSNLLLKISDDTRTIIIGPEIQITKSNYIENILLDSNSFINNLTMANILIDNIIYLIR